MAGAAGCLWRGSPAVEPAACPDQALQRSEQALAMANELANPANLINTLCFVVIVHVLRRELSAARQRAKAAMEISAEQRHSFYLGHGTVLHGWARAAQGQVEDGIAEIEHGITTFKATGARTWIPYFLGLQAETYGRAKRIDDGLGSVAEALALADETEQHCWQAELSRVKGELLLAVSSNNHAEAERCFFQALDITRRQQAKSWELRAAMSLSRLRRRQGEADEARDLLVPIYDWFGEGFDTQDLVEAKALLDELA